MSSRRPLTHFAGKPRFPFSVDFSNPLCRGLYHAYPMGIVGKATLCRDAARRNDILWFPAEPAGGTYAITEKGNAAAITGAGNYIGKAGSDTPEVGPGQGFTCLARVYSTNISGNPAIATQYEATNPYFQLFYLSDGKLFARILKNATNYIQRNSAASVLAANTWYDVAMTWDGGTTDAAIKSYVNGVRVDTTNVGSGTFTNSSTTAVVIQLGHQAGGNLLTGNMAFCYFWNRPLTQNEIIKLRIDPYQILRRRTLELKPGAAAAFKAAWARNANTVLGTGIRA